MVSRTSYKQNANKLVGIPEKTSSESHPIEPSLISPTEVVVSASPPYNAKVVKYMNLPPIPISIRSENNGTNYKICAYKLDLHGESLKIQKSNTSTQYITQNITAIADQKTSTVDGNEIKNMSGVQTSAIAVLTKYSGTEASTIESASQSEFSRPFELTHPLTSSIFCHRNDTAGRICSFKNLYYDPKADRFIVFKDERTLEVNVPRNRPDLLDSATVDSHVFYPFDYDEVHPDSFPYKNIYMVDKRSFLFSRYRPTI